MWDIASEGGQNKITWFYLFKGLSIDSAENVEELDLKICLDKK